MISTLVTWGYKLILEGSLLTDKVQIINLDLLELRVTLQKGELQHGSFGSGGCCILPVLTPGSLYISLPHFLWLGAMCFMREYSESLGFQTQMFSLLTFFRQCCWKLNQLSDLSININLKINLLPSFRLHWEGEFNGKKSLFTSHCPQFMK